MEAWDNQGHSTPKKAQSEAKHEQASEFASNSMPSEGDIVSMVGDCPFEMSNMGGSSQEYLEKAEIVVREAQEGKLIEDMSPIGNAQPIDSGSSSSQAIGNSVSKNQQFVNPDSIEEFQLFINYSLGQGTENRKEMHQIEPKIECEDLEKDVEDNNEFAGNKKSEL